jgi:hypothetical protein
MILAFEFTNFKGYLWEYVSLHTSLNYELGHIPNRVVVIYVLDNIPGFLSRGTEKSYDKLHAITAELQFEARDRELSNMKHER